MWGMRKAGESNVEEAKRKLMVASDLLDPPPTALETVKQEPVTLRDRMLEKVGGDPFEAVAAAFGLGFLMGMFPSATRSSTKGVFARLLR
jgi:hypothetical protein